MYISCIYHQEKLACWNPEALTKMYNLKFLRILGFHHVIENLPNDLRVLDWESYHSKSLPSSFQLDELIQLRLRYSKIEQLWIERKVIVLLTIITTLALNFYKWTLGS